MTLLCEELRCAVWENSHQRKGTGSSVGPSSNVDFDLFYELTSYLCSSWHLVCTLCKEENDCSVYIRKRTVQYRLLQKLKTLGAFQGYEFVMWKNSRILECRSNKCEYSEEEGMSRGVHRKRLARFKNQGVLVRHSRDWGFLFVCFWTELFAQVFHNFPRHLSCALQRTL